MDHNKIMDNELLWAPPRRAREIAEKGGFSYRTITRWAKKGKIRTLPTLDRRGKVLYCEQDIVRRMDRLTSSYRFPITKEIAKQESKVRDLRWKLQSAIGQLHAIKTLGPANKSLDRLTELLIMRGVDISSSEPWIYLCSRSGRREVMDRYCPECGSMIPDANHVKLRQAEPGTKEKRENEAWQKKNQHLVDEATRELKVAEARLEELQIQLSQQIKERA